MMLLLLALAAHAETVPYVNLTGALGFGLKNVGDFGLGVEQVFGEHLGLLAEATLVHVHGDPTHATLYGGQLGLRLHAAPADAPFVGLLAGWRTGRARFYIEEHGGPYWGYDLSLLSLTPHVGYRWSLGEHAAVTSRLGVGYGRWSVDAEEEGADVEAAQQRLEDRVQTGPVKLDLELSVGWRF